MVLNIKLYLYKLVSLFELLFELLKMQRHCFANVWQKPLQYCKVISLQLIKINGKITISFKDIKAENFKT